MFRLLKHYSFTIGCLLLLDVASPTILTRFFLHALIFLHSQSCLIIGFLPALYKHLQCEGDYVRESYSCLTWLLFSADVSPGITSFATCNIISWSFLKQVSTLSLCFLLSSDWITIRSDFFTKSELRIIVCRGSGMMGSKEGRSTRKVAFEFTL